VSAGSLTFTHFDYRVGLEHDLTPQNMIYATVATGYRPGGFNLGAGTFKSETVTDFELGSKNKFLNDRVIMNVDGFFYNYKNFQLLDFYGAATSSCAPGPPVFPPTYNLDARNFGADFTLAALATNQDTVNVALEYLHSRFTSSALISYNPIDNCRLFDLGLDPTEANTVDSFELSDAVEPHSPTISGNLSWEHRFGLPGGGTLAARPAMYFSSAYFVHPEEFAESNQPAYSTYEFTLTYSPSDGKYSVAAWGRNLGDYAVKEALVPVTIGPPRTYGVTISAHL
jgi:iron complex outermembrane receptor protein